MSWFFDPLPLFGFDLMAIDVPSEFETWSDAGQEKGPGAQYETMTDDEIAAMPVGHLASSHCWAFVWATGPKLPQALQWMTGWGFEYVTHAAWRKVTVNGKPRRGTGYVAISYHETVLIGRVGNPTYRRGFDSLFDGVAREHSRKPEEFYERVDRFAPASYRKLDLFSRQSRPGWTTWGREATKFDAAPELGNITNTACFSRGAAPTIGHAKAADTGMSGGPLDQGLQGALVYEK